MFPQQFQTRINFSTKFLPAMKNWKNIYLSHFQNHKYWRSRKTWVSKSNYSFIQGLWLELSRLSFRVNITLTILHSNIGGFKKTKNLSWHSVCEWIHSMYLPTILLDREWCKSKKQENCIRGGTDLLLGELKPCKRNNFNYLNFHWIWSLRNTITTMNVFLSSVPTSSIFEFL